MSHSNTRQPSGDLSAGRLLLILAVVILLAGLFGGFLGASSAGLL